MRYTRQLVTAVAVAAAAVGLGACSAHPGAAVVTSAGSYSIDEMSEAVQQLSVLTGGQEVSADQIRAQLINASLLDAGAAAVGIVVPESQIDEVISRAAHSQNAEGFEAGRATRVTVRAIVTTQSLNQVAQKNPAVVDSLNAAMSEARESLDAHVNPRFAQPTLGGGQAPTKPMFGDAVAGTARGAASASAGGAPAGSAH